MPLGIRVAAAVIFWVGSLFFVVLIGASLLTIEIADSIGSPSWTHTNPMASLGASFVVCLMELVLTTAIDGQSKVGTIACSCLLAVACALLFLLSTLGSWFVLVSVTSLLWNLLLLRQAVQGRRLDSA